MYRVIIRGTNTYFVDEIGSSAMVGGFLYVDGKKVGEGIYTFPTDTGDKVVTVNAKGAVVSYV